MNFLHWRSVLFFIIVVTGVTQPTNVLAYPGGISGYSGSHGPTCSTCHAGGSGAVTLTLAAVAGSTTVVAGSTSSYTLTFSGDTGAGGFDIAAPDGKLISTNSLSRLSNYELVHSKQNYTSTVKFDWQAPAIEGSYKIYAAIYYPGVKNSYTLNTTLTITVEPKSGATSPATSAGGSGSGGGCALNPQASFDPLFPLLFLVTGLYIYIRREK